MKGRIFLFYFFRGGFFCLLESIFYFQFLFFLMLLGYAIYTRSASVFALVGVFSVLTGLMLVTEGISFPSGWDVSGVEDSNNLFVRETYTTYMTVDSSAVNMWHYVLLYGGFVWFIVAFVLVIRGRLAGRIPGT